MARIDGYVAAPPSCNPATPRSRGWRVSRLSRLSRKSEHVVPSIANANLEAGLDEAIAVGAKAVTIFASGHLDDDACPPLSSVRGQKRKRPASRSAGLTAWGFYVPTIGLRAASFPSPLGLRKGGIAWLAQSGSAFSRVLPYDCRLRLFALAVSTGRKASSLSPITCAGSAVWRDARRRPRKRASARSPSKPPSRCWRRNASPSSRSRSDAPPGVRPWRRPIRRTRRNGRRVSRLVCHLRRAPGRRPRRDGSAAGDVRHAAQRGLWGWPPCTTGVASAS